MIGKHSIYHLLISQPRVFNTPHVKPHKQPKSTMSDPSASDPPASDGYADDVRSTAINIKLVYEDLLRFIEVSVDQIKKLLDYLSAQLLFLSENVHRHNLKEIVTTAILNCQHDIAHKILSCMETYLEIAEKNKKSLESIQKFISEAIEVVKNDVATYEKLVLAQIEERSDTWNDSDKEHVQKQLDILKNIKFDSLEECNATQRKLETKIFDIIKACSPFAYSEADFTTAAKPSDEANATVAKPSGGAGSAT